MIFTTPELGPEDAQVLGGIHAMRRELANVLRAPKRWQGGLRRNMLARAIQGSNNIEGYVVAEDDAAAALDDEEPLGADAITFAEIRGYRHALGYVLQMANETLRDGDRGSSKHALHDALPRPGEEPWAVPHGADLRT